MSCIVNVYQIQDVIALDGVVLSIQRPYVQAIDLIPDRFIELRMVIREEHETLSSATEELENCTLPADGVIGVCTKLGTTYRIKKPTVDLVLAGEDLCTGSLEKNRTAGLKRREGMLQGFVYECELNVVSPSEYTVEKHTFRPDKLYGNSRNVFESVILNACGNAGYDMAVRRGVTDISFALRNMVYERAMNRMVNGRLLIDVGSVLSSIRA
ncbi:hypothetical protein DFQ28_011555 [Apophysomyces sp. BC1034]|nr:hypothetical protein DFQ28_011555 [Apophysomyces sp. BC1034]